MATMTEPEWMMVHCGDCDYEWRLVRLPAPVNVVVKAMKGAMCPSCYKTKILNGPNIKAWSEGDLMAWLASGDTGTSSQTIAAILSGNRAIARHGYNIPWDPDDFGRCHRLLAKMPGWRERLPEVATAAPRWASLVGAWDELTTLYEEELPSGRCPKLYDRMQELIDRDGAR